MGKKGRARRYFGRLRGRVRRRRGPKTIPIAATLGVVSMFATANPWTGVSVLDDVLAGRWDNALYNAREKFLCIDSAGRFHGDQLLANWAPVAIGVGISLIGGKFANRYIRRIPFVGKYISL